MSEFKHTENSLRFVQAMLDELSNNTKHNKTTVEKIAVKFGIENKNLVKELTEFAIVKKARMLANNHVYTIREKYNIIVALYNSQVNLSQRTSESILLQQYSTPAPIGFLMGVFVQQITENLSGSYVAFKKIGMSDRAFKEKWGVLPGQIDHSKKHHDINFQVPYLEPSAGNGQLTIAINPKLLYVNEIDDVRYANLCQQDYAAVYSFDASKNYAIEENFYKKFEGVLTNPPFGSLETEVTYGEGADKFGIKTLDHLMCLRALDCMKDHGKAAMIIGGHTSWDENGRIQAGKNRIFFNYLYRYYHVADVINLDGHKLYSRQGTAFNVRLILINGRKYKPEGVAPLKQRHETVVYSFDELWDRVLLSLTESPMPKGSDDLAAQLKRIRQALLNSDGKNDE